MAIFDNPTDAFKTGFDAAQNVTDTWRRQRAQNVLARAYGPDVTSFQDAADKQNLDLNSQLNPLKVQEAQQTVDFNTAANPAKLQALDLSNQGTQLQNEQAGQTVESNNLSIQATKALQVHGVLSASLDSLGNQLANVTDPTQRGALFDAEIQNIAPLVGADPRVIASQLRAERDRIVKDGATAVPQIQTELDSLITGQLSPADRQKLMNAQAQGQLTQAQIDKAKAQTDAVNAKTAATAATGGRTPAQQAKFDNQKMAAGGALDDFVASNENVNSAIDEAIALAQANPRATGPMANLANLPGVGAAVNGPAYELARKLDTIKSNLGFNKLQEIRKNSPTGGSLGSISDFEEKLLQSTITSLDQAQDSKTVINNLLKVRKAMAEAETRMRQAYEKDFAPPAAATASPAADQAAGGTNAPQGAQASPASAGGAGAATYTFNPATGELE